MIRRRPLPKRLQEHLDNLCKDSKEAQAAIRKVMRAALSNPKFWAGGKSRPIKGRLIKKVFLTELGFSVGSIGDIANVWHELVACELLQDSYDYRLCFALGALGFDPETWLENHGPHGRGSVARITRAFNELLVEKGYRMARVRWCGAKGAIDFLTR